MLIKLFGRKYLEAIEDGGEGGGTGGEGGTGERDLDGAGDKGGEGEGHQQQGAEGEGGKVIQGKWADTWRDDISGGDEKTRKIMDRYGSPKDVATALMAAQQKIRSGELGTRLSENPTEQELADYRKENGIPEKADDYKIELSDGRVFGDEDKEAVDAFKKMAHDMNYTPAQLNAGLNAYMDIQEQFTQQMHDADVQAEQAGEEALRQTWGNDFKRNIGAMHATLDGVMNEDLKLNFLEGRLADGTPIGSHPALLEALLQLSLNANPSATLGFSGAGDQSGSIADEIKEIETLMRTDRAAYNKDEALQERYRELLSAREELKKRGD